MKGGRGVGSTSFGVEVRAATSRLVAMRRKIEDDAAALKIGKVRIRDQSPQSSDFGAPVPRRGRFGQTADFSSPTKVRDRPRSKNGATSFHFAVTKIKRPAGTISGGRPLPGFAAKASPASDHARYVERADALEIGAFDRADDMVIDLRQPSQSLLPRVANDDSNAILTNISADADERHEFWLAVERNERQARSHAIVLDPTKSPPWWAGIDAKAKLPASFRFHCIMERHRYLDWLEDTSKDKEKFRSKAYVADAEACGRALAAAQQIAGFNRKQPPLRLRAGRSGRVQMRIVAELPHELTSAQRGDLVRKYCEYLSSFARDDDGNSVGMMFTAAIHRPDAEGDSRNYHVHICCYDRPARWLFQENCWDFAYETQEREGSKSVTRYPLRQKKIIEVSRTLNAAKRAAHPHFNATIAGMNFIPHLRAKFAEACNAALRAAKSAKRVDPRSYKAMLIDLAPGRHLGSAAASLENAGVPTKTGTYNASIEWSDVERQIRRSADRELEQSRARARELADVIGRVRWFKDCSDKRLLSDLARERRELSRSLHEDRCELRLNTMLLAQLRSRAEQVIMRCKTLLASKKLRTKRHIEAVESRKLEARNFLAGIDEAEQSQQPLIKAATADVVRRDERIAAIDAVLMPALARLREMIKQAPKELPFSPDRFLERLQEDCAISAKRAETPVAASLQRAQPDVVSDTSKSAQAAETAPRPAPAAIEQISAPQLETKHDVRTPKDPYHLALVASLDFELPEPGAGAPRLLQRVQSLAGVRGLSGLPMVRDVERTQGLVSTVLGPDSGVQGPRQSGGHDNELQSAADSDRDGAERAACEEGLTVGEDVSANFPPMVASAKTVPPSVQTSAGRALPDAGAVGPNLAVPGERAHAHRSASSNDQDNTHEPKISSSAERLPKPAVENSLPPAAMLRPEPSSVSAAARLQDKIDPLLASIEQKRLRIAAASDTSKTGLTVPGLAKTESDLLAEPALAGYIQHRLSDIHKRQTSEIERLAEWIKSTGRDAQALRLIRQEDHFAVQIVNAPEMRELLVAWKTVDLVKLALRTEQDRRDEERRKMKARAKLQADKIKAAKEALYIARAERVRERVQEFGEVRSARTRQVKKLIKFLITDAPHSKVQEAAEAIFADDNARGDVQHQRAALMRVYNGALDADFSIYQAFASKDRSR